MADNCLFCSIVAGAVPADVVYQDDDVIAIRDIAPQAPVHLLVMPMEHHDNLAALTAEDVGLSVAVFAAAAALAESLDLDADGYRLVVNTGQQGGQTVEHVHVHLLGGRQMVWPPG